MEAIDRFIWIDIFITASLIIPGLFAMICGLYSDLKMGRSPRIQIIGLKGHGRGDSSPWLTIGFYISIMGFLKLAVSWPIIRDLLIRMFIETASKGG